MRNLLRANLRRLWRDSGFWLMLSAVLVLSAGNMLNGCRQAAMDTMSDFSFRLDDYYFNIAPMLGLFCAVFPASFWARSTVTAPSATSWWWAAPGTRSIWPACP